MLKNITAHVNLKTVKPKTNKGEEGYFIPLPKLIKEFMEFNGREPISLRYNEKLGILIIQAEKAVAGL